MHVAARGWCSVSPSRVAWNTRRRFAAHRVRTSRPRCRRARLSAASTRGWWTSAPARTLRSSQPSWCSLLTTRRMHYARRAAQAPAGLCHGLPCAVMEHLSSLHLLMSRRLSLARSGLPYILCLLPHFVQAEVLPQPLWRRRAHRTEKRCIASG